jgi:hypothetical protein
MEFALPLRRRIPPGVFPFTLFLLNAYLCRELFTTEYTRHMGSIEAAYISISRLMMNHWGDLSWFPEWYCGIPQQNSYPPLLHFLVAGAASLGHISPALSHHVVSAVFYSFGPVALYLLAARLSESRWTAFVAGLVYSLAAPSLVLVSLLRHDIGGALLDQRLHVLVSWGEGPHITSVALLPLAVLALDRALDSKRPGDVLLSAVAMAAVVLTNWLGAFALAVAALCLLLTRVERVDMSLARLSAWAGGAAVLSYLLASPWIPPSTIRTIEANARLIGGDYRHTYVVLPLFCAASLIGLTAARWWMRRIGAPRGLQFFLLFSLMMAVVTLAAFWAGVNLLPQPERYHIEMDLGLCGLAACGGAWVLSRFPPLWNRRAAIAVPIVLTAALVPQVFRYRKFAHRLITPVDIRSTTEYKTAIWMDAHAHGGRVMVPGASSFWFNAFSDTPQFGGGFDQGRPYAIYPMASYFLYRGEGGDTGEVTRLWLQALGVQAVAVGGEKSGEYYKPFRNPGRFEELPVLWREGDDTIYSVPQRSASLAHVVAEGEWVRHTPWYAYDVGEIRHFVDAINNPRRGAADFRWTSRHSARITADLKPGERLEIQENWHAGWRASVDGQARPVERDGLDFLLIDPQCSGRCVVDLVYDGGVEMKLAKLSSAGALLGCFFWIVADWRLRRAARRRA